MKHRQEWRNWKNLVLTKKDSQSEREMRRFSKIREMKRAYGILYELFI